MDDKNIIIEMSTKGNKKSKYDKQEVINTLLNMRLNQSKSIKSIKEYLMNDLGYSVSQTYIYLGLVRDEIYDSYKQDNKTLVEESIAEIEQVMELARGSGNLKLWIELRKEKNKIIGAYAPEKQDITIKEFKTDWGENKEQP